MASTSTPANTATEPVNTTSNIDTAPSLSEESPQSDAAQNGRPAEPAVVSWDNLDTETKQLFISKVDSVEPPSSTNFLPSLGAFNDRWVRVFDAEDVWRAQSIAEVEGKQYETLRPIYDASREYGGRREIPAFDAKALTLQLQKLATEMPNFSSAIDYLLAEFGFLLTGKVKDFRIEPLMLVGGPGLGKTRFVGQLAAILGVKYEKVSAGTLQTSGDLAGSSRMWSNTRPGRIARLLAESKQACPIVLLDEIDKLSQSDHYPVTPVLLELLEPDSAKTFRDESLEIRFDTSRLIHVATANEIDHVDGPIRSRFHIIEIKAPDPHQRRAIIANVFRDIVSGREFEIEPNVIDKIAEIDTDLRELRRLLRQAVGHALLNEERCLRIHHLNLQIRPERQRIGFI